MSSFRNARPARRVGLTRLAMVVLAATLGTAATTLAQEGSREIEAARQRLHELTAQAERALEHGQHERAEHLMRQAEQLEQRIHRHLREQDRAAEREHGEREHAEREHGEREHAERERGEREHAERGEVLEGLKRGIWALRQIGRNQEAQHLANIAEGVARRLDQALHGRREREQRGEHEQGADAERREARRHFAIVRFAVEGLVEADRHDAADLLERALRARELELEGRHDEEAMHIRESAPGREDVIELLSLAARELHRQGRGERAAAVVELTRQLRHPRETDRRRDMDRPHERDDRRPERRERLKHQVEIMQMAIPALREGNRKELAETIKRAIQVRQVNLRGLEGEEARVVRERAPSLGQTVEILGLAAKLWREFGNDDKAEAIANLAEHMWAQRERPDRDRPHRDRRRDRDDR